MNVSYRFSERITIYINNIPNTTPLLTASDIKYLQSLRLGKFRQKYNKFVVEGDKCCIEFLKTQMYHIDTIYASKDWERLHSDILSSHSKNKVTIVDSKEMKKISQLKTPTDVVCYAIWQIIVLNNR